MADKTITQLNDAGDIGGTEEIHIVDGSGNSRRLTLSELKKFINTDPSVVPSSVPWRGAQVILASDFNISSYTITLIPWETKISDTDNFWSSGSPTRFTIPTGVTKVRFNFGIRLAGEPLLGHLMLYKNGATCPNTPTFGTEVQDNFLVSAIIPVVDGDYFEAAFWASSNEVIENNNGRSFFEIEVIEAQ